MADKVIALVLEIFVVHGVNRKLNNNKKETRSLTEYSGNCMPH